MLTVHMLDTTVDAVDDRHDPANTTPACGFIVSRAVGGSVVRHRVLRRLRHLMAARLESLPAGSRLVIRAFPTAATASSAALSTALDASLRGVLGQPVQRPPVETAPRR